MWGFFAAFVVTEIAFYLFHNNPAWPLAYGSSDLGNIAFLVYVAISALLIAGAARLVPQDMRPLALGITIGQAIAGLLYYFGIMPDSAARVEMYPAVYASIRGFVFPEIVPTSRFVEWIALVLLALTIIVFMWRQAGREMERTGRVIPRLRYAVMIAALGIIGGWLLVGAEPAPENILVDQDGETVLMPVAAAEQQDLLTPQDKQQISQSPLLLLMPEQNRFGRFDIGAEITPEYTALLVALVIYTSAFIAEIVRAGIQAVPYGQIEAARALGLNQSQVLGQIVLPQALRVIIPPLGNQYLNLSKNSSLAIGIGYADLFMVSNTVMNQSGQTVTTFAILMVFYLVISLSIALVMNQVNRRFQLVTR
jgi:ABC-type amino acid transport system permease subunit